MFANINQHVEYFKTVRPSWGNVLTNLFKFLHKRDQRIEHYQCTKFRANQRGPPPTLVKFSKRHANLTLRLRLPGPPTLVIAEAERAAGRSGSAPAPDRADTFVKMADALDIQIRALRCASRSQFRANAGRKRRFIHSLIRNNLL